MKQYIAFYKPYGVLCQFTGQDGDRTLSEFDLPPEVYAAGRLDKDSEGLIFLTNDGDIVNKILRSGNKHEKEYVVKVDHRITQSFIYSMAKGVPVLGKVTKECHVEKIDDFHFRITLTEGRNRQIRRMCSYFNYHVTRLVRVRIMNVTVEGIKPGKWRYLTKQEVEEIKSLTKESSKTEKASQ